MPSPWIVKNEFNQTYWMNQIVRMNRVRSLEVPIKICLFLEGIIIIFIVIQLVCYFYILFKWQPYHINMRMLGASQLTAFGLGFGSRIVMILYEVELISCKTLADSPLPLLNTFRMWNYNMVFQIPLTLTVERFFATKFLSDYENKRRPWIGGFIICPVMAITFIMSLLSVNGVIDGNKATALSMVPILFFIYLFRRLLLENESEMERLHQLFDRRRSSAVYSLSLRVQLNENIGIMQATYRPLILLLLSAPIDIASVSLPSFLITDQRNYWMLDICSAAANLIVAISAVTVAPAVAYQFIRYYRNRVAPFKMPHTERKPSPYEIEDRRKSNLHFDMLHAQWERAKTESKLSGERTSRIVDGDVTMWR